MSTRRPDTKSYEIGETRKRREFLGLRRWPNEALSDSADGKTDLHARTSGWRGPDRHPPVMGHDDLLHQGETKASALLLGGEERAKHAVARLGLDPRSVVLDADSDQALFAIDLAVDDD